VDYALQKETWVKSVEAFEELFWETRYNLVASEHKRLRAMWWEVRLKRKVELEHAGICLLCLAFIL
jgi:hypothetical protein